MAEARTPDPAFAGRFLLKIGGKEIGSFMEVSGLSVQLGVEDLVEGGQNHYVHHLPKGLTWPNLVFKRGVTHADPLFQWLWQSSGEGFARAGNTLTTVSGTISVLDPHKKPVRSWFFEGAYPVKWSGPTLAASSSSLAVEELEVCHRGFRAAT